jgi:succinate dehydrogenase/fumarate reductase flavoprotein subunit
VIVPVPARWEHATDVCVAGAGGCGMTAALAAAEAGAQVLLLDRDRGGQCNTARSGGMIPAGGTRLQRAAGIADSPEQFAREIFDKNGGASPAALTRRLCAEAPALVEWLIDRHGVRLELVTDFMYPGHRRYRMHAPRERTGRALFAMLRDAVRRLDAITLVVGARATGLVAADGAVAGVQVDGSEHVRARKVVLAGNGFGGNAEMVKRFLPDMVGALYFGGEASTGEMILWGEALGAATAFMDAYQGHASVAEPGGTLVSYAVIMQGGIMVNRAGRRFADESRGYSEHAVDVIRQPGGVAVEILDGAIHEQALQFPDYREGVDAGLVKRADDAAGLARVFGLPAAPLAATLAAWAEACRTGRPDEVGRAPAARPLAPPYRGVQVTGALIHTQGGLVVDLDARVLRPDGAPVPNLYAGGGVAAGLSGHGVGGYLSGNGLLTALGLGRLAGRHAASAIG